MPATHRPVLAPWWDISENTPPSERKSGPARLRVYPAICRSVMCERYRLRARRPGDLFRRNLGCDDLPKLDCGSAAQHGSFDFRDGGLMATTEQGALMFSCSGLFLEFSRWEQCRT